MKKLLLPLIILTVIGCKPSDSVKTKEADNPGSMKNTTVNKDSIHMYELKNANGIEVVLTNYGARIVSVLTPDKKGEFADIALGYNTIDEYLSDNIYSGPIVGRFANRIKDAKFTLDGKEYTLYKNNGDNTLHGGLNGFDKKVWTASQEGNSVKMTYLSPDMEEGYPGNLAVTVVYTLTDKDELKIEYEAETDAATILNLTNHTIWNLKGEGDSTILDHYFMINADEFIPVDKEWIPTGEIASVEGTALDFREGKQIGQDIAIGDPQVENGLGFDHNWNLIKKSEDELSLAGKLWEETTGRLLEIWTTEPGMQFYSGNFLDGTVKGKSGRAYQHRSALIFETQHYPDAPNNPGFPTTVLKPGEVYKQTTIIRFKVKE